HVLDPGHLEAGPLQRANGRLTTRSRSLDPDLDFLEAQFHRLAGGRFSSHLSGKGRALLRALETLAAGRSPGDGVAVGIGDGHDGVVIRGADVSDALDHLQALTLPRSLAAAASLLPGHV